MRRGRENTETNQSTEEKEKIEYSNSFIDCAIYNITLTYIIILVKRSIQLVIVITFYLIERLIIHSHVISKF